MAAIPVDNRCLDLARQIASTCYEKRAENVHLLDVRGLCGYADFFVFATIANRPQGKGIMRDIEKAMKKEKLKIIGEAGRSDGRWILIDFGDIIVHLFDDENRDYYQIEEMWGDAPRLEFPTGRRETGE